MTSNGPASQPPTLPIDGREMTFPTFERKLVALRQAVDAAWDTLDGDHPGWHYWASALSRYQLEVANHLSQRLRKCVLEEYGPDLDERDLPYILDHAIRLACLVEGHVRARYLGVTEVPAGEIWDQLPS
jgi:hypothetical protein